MLRAHTGVARMGILNNGCKSSNFYLPLFDFRTTVMPPVIVTSATIRQQVVLIY